MDCSRLLQSFAERVKVGGKSGTQYKKIPKPDPVAELIKQRSSEIYKMHYGNE